MSKLNLIRCVPPARKLACAKAQRCLTAPAARGPLQRHETNARRPQFLRTDSRVSRPTGLLPVAGLRRRILIPALRTAEIQRLAIHDFPNRVGACDVSPADGV